MSILIASGQLDCKTDFVFLGELALDGSLRPVTGILPVLISARNKGFKKFVIPYSNANEASYIEGTEVYALKNLADAVSFLKGEGCFQPVTHRSFVAKRAETSYNCDMSLVRGQRTAKRALEKAGEAGLENAMFRGVFEQIGKRLTQQAVKKAVPVVSAAIGAFFDTAQMNKVLDYADVFYQKRFILEKGMRQNFVCEADGSIE